MIGGQLPIPPGFTDRISKSPFFQRKRAYKFIHAKHRSAIVERGSIKIGRVTDYRNIEKSALRDVAEGVLSGLAPHALTDASLFYPDGVAHRSVRRLFGENLKGIRFADTRFQEQLPDVSIYCFSYRCDTAVLNSFDDSEPYDAVLEITDVFELARRIVKYHPILKGWHWFCFPVIYCNRGKSVFEPDLHVTENYFEKDIKFAANCEGRILFLPHHHMIGPIPLGPLAIWRHPRIAALFRRKALPLFAEKS